MQQVDDPPSLPVGTEVSAKYKGAFCEAKVSKVVRNIKVKVAYKQGLGSGIVSDDAIKAAPGQLRVGAIVEVRHPDRKENVEATITKIQDCSQYTVVFDDGDITTLRRTALCLKSGRHFNESETLDQLPLTHPEHFGNPVVGGRRGRRRGQLNDGSSDDDDESDAKEVVNEKEENIGKVVCVETESKKKDKEKWFPALVVAPTAQVSKQATVRIRVKDEYLVRSFKDGRYYTVPKKEANEFTREMAAKQDGPAVLAAMEFLDSSVLPAHWDRDSLFGLSNLTSDDEGEIDSDSSDDEPHEEKDLFVAQLYKYMDDRGTPLNKVPSIQSRDVDLYRLFRAVQKRGGYNRVTAKTQWKNIAMRLGFTPCTLSVMNLVKQAYKKFLQPYGDFHRKLGCSMLMPSRNSNRSKGRSLVRANSVASPKPADVSKMEAISKLNVAIHTASVFSGNNNNNSNNAASTATATTSTAASSSSSHSTTAATPLRAASRASQSAAEESENTSESSVVVEPVKKQRKASAASTGKVKSLVEKYEEKSTEKSQATAAAATATTIATTAATAAASATTTAAAVAATSTAAAVATVSSNSATTASTSSSAITAAATPAATTTATPAATSSAATSGTTSHSKDTEADVPLSKIKAAAAKRHSVSIDKELNASGSNASSKAASETQRSRDVSPTTTSTAAATATTTTTSVAAAAATTTTTAAATSSAAATGATISVGSAAGVGAAAGASGGGGATTATATTKKEKHQQRKQVDKNDEKRGKRKKDEITVEKIDTGDFIVGIGDKLKVNYHEKKSPSSHGSTYEAKVIEISVQRGVPMYLVHYTGWNNRYDEWVPRERIAENLTKGSKQKTRTISTSSANSGGAPAAAAASTAASAQQSTAAGNTLPPGAGGGAAGASAGNINLLPKDAPGGKAVTTTAGTAEQQQPGNSGSGAAVLQAASKTSSSTSATATVAAAATAGAAAAAAATTSAASLASGKRGRGRSDSMPPRSTTPSSVASNSSRTKSPAASQSQLKQKRPTRTLQSQHASNNQGRRVSASASVSANVSDASLGSDTDTDSDEPVRRPKRLSAKEQQQQQQSNFGKTATKGTAAATAAKKTASAMRLQRASGSEETDEDEEEEQQQQQQQSPRASQPNPNASKQQTTPSVQRQRAGNRALSSGSAATVAAGAAAGKGRDYDLSEIRSELKGFQPQLIERKDAAAAAVNIKSEPSETQAKQEPKTAGSSTEQSSETDSYVDEDSQSSEKIEYRGKQTSAPAGDKTKLNIDKLKAGAVTTAAHDAAGDAGGIKKESELQLKHIKHEAVAGEERKQFKTEPKEEQVKPFHSSSDIKPTTTATTSLIAPARFSGSSSIASGGSKCTSVIVEKPLTFVKKAEATAGVGGGAAATGAATAAGATGVTTSMLTPAKKLELLKKQQPSVATTEAAKKFVEPVQHKETATLKVELPAACSPSNSSSSSSSFCSSSNNSAITTVSMSSSSATRSLPDMSKLEISSGTTTTAAAASAAGAAGAAGTAATVVKESKYSNSSASGSSGSGSSSSSSNIASAFKHLSSDVYEFKDTEPFEFEKRISPMAAMSCGGTSVIATAATPATGSSTSIASSNNNNSSSGSNTSAGSNVATTVVRKQALKASSMEKHQLPHEQQRATTAAAAATVAAGTAAAAATTAAAAAARAVAALNVAPFKGKKRGSPLKEGVDKSKLPKLDTQQQSSTAATLAHNTPTTSPNSVKPTAVAAAKANATTAATAAAAVAAATTVATSTQLQPGHATLFDVVRKSPSFNLNITALNEELAQTVQETTRALTDALQPPTTPLTPATPATPPATTAAAAANALATSPIAVPVSPKLSTPPQAMGLAKTTQQQQHIVGSPFMETRNVFELSTSNEGSGYSSGESNKDNKLEKLENVKILLAGAAGPFDLDAVKYEQKPSSIADKVLKAISQKKEEVEQSKTKTQTQALTDNSNNLEKEQLGQLPTTSAITKTEPGSSLNLKLATLKLLSEPLEIQTGAGAAAAAAAAGGSVVGATLPVLSDLYRRNSCRNSPETKSILEASLPEKNIKLGEIIQKLECAIQQRKTPVAGQSLASSTAGTPPVTATAAASFSDESMDSTDSEQRLVIEDVLTEEPSLVSELKSPLSEASGSLSGSVPVKLEPTTLGGKQLAGVAAPIALKPMPRVPVSGTGVGVGMGMGGGGGGGMGVAANTSPVLPSCVSIVLPEIPVSVVVALRHSPGGAANSLSPASPKPPELNQKSTLSDDMLLLYRSQSPAVSDAVVANSSPQTQSRPFVLQPAKDTSLNVSPAASSPLITDVIHIEAAINLLCEETIPGSPAPNYSSKDEPNNGQVVAVAAAATSATVVGAAASPITSTSAIAASLGISPLPPDTPLARVVPAAHVSQQSAAAATTATVAGATLPQHTTATAATTTTAAAAAVAATATASVSPNSSPDSPASQHDSSEENGSISLLNAVKKYVELESTFLAGRRKRARNKAADSNAQSSGQMTAAAAAAELHALGKRRRQHLNSMRKTTTTTAGSDTDDNSDHVVTTQRQQQQQLQQQQQQQHQQLQQQQQQLQQQLPATLNASGVRPCPYNFLVELDPSLSAEQCILILRKQIQDLRKAYNTIKGELAVIDRRRKKLRRREREKKQQQLQGGQQGKICT